jgi:ABC-type transporter Mla MlaB component
MGSPTLQVISQAFYSSAVMATAAISLSRLHRLDRAAPGPLCEQTRSCHADVELTRSFDTY